MQILVKQLSKAIVALAIATGSNAAFASFVYQHDNGIAYSQGGYTAGNNALVGNWFATQPGYGTINDISVYWSSAPGAAVTLGIVNDPNGDGNLSDGTLLSSVTVTPGAGDIGNFVTYPISPATVGGGFFAAAYIVAGPGGAFAIPIDSSTSNVDDTRAVQGSGSFLSMAQLAPGYTSHYALIRTTSVPEPATIALFGLGLAGLGFSRRRKRT